MFGVWWRHRHFGGHVTRFGDAGVAGCGGFGVADTPQSSHAATSLYTHRSSVADAYGQAADFASHATDVGTTGFGTADVCSAGVGPNRRRAGFGSRSGASRDVAGYGARDAVSGNGVAGNGNPVCLGATGSSTNGNAGDDAGVCLGGN